MGAPGTDATEEVAELVSCIGDLESNVVLILCTDGVSLGLGSGTVTPAGTVVTAAHVAPDLTTFVCDVHDADGSGLTLLGEVTASTPDASGLDRTTLSVAWQGTPPPGVPSVVAPPALGELTAAAGHPNGLLATQISTGFVMATGMQEFGATWAGAFMADYSSNGGGSGGPIFDADCQWVGIHVGGFTDGLESSIALPF